MVISRDDNELLIRHVDGPSIFELFVKLMLLDILLVGWLYKSPDLLGLRAALFCFFYDLAYVSVHNHAACILIKHSLLLGVGSVPDTAGLKCVWDDFVVEFLGHLLHLHFLVVLKEGHYFVKYEKGLSKFVHLLFYRLII